ncbi:MAG: GNAT family N-acetyltransferase [Bryobacteraceae bacterium]|nr:GNAT family N-acetyltransferase [Bryobacteraceae bacterium]MDW8377394.1 GNAT family N-acetyltransferase [Bryobacterales bacterium]
MSIAVQAAAPNLKLVDLREISGSSLVPLLEEEIDWWRRTLFWDMRSSAELVVKFVNLGSLQGGALLHQERVVGYTYYVLEGSKGLIGDVYMLREFRDIFWENRLIQHALDDLRAKHGIRRVESQLLLIEAPLAHVMPRAEHVRAYHRMFLMRSIKPLGLSPVEVGPSLLFEPWREECMDEAARLIAESYAGHVDSEINDQYQSPHGARKFLDTMIHYPGCGEFCQPASWVAFQKDTGLVCGLVLASVVAPGVGHITQVCVAKAWRGMAIGYELLRRAMASFDDLGCHRVGLTVTASNHEAVRLYQRMGFVNIRDFAAHVWTGL